MILNELI